MRQPIMMSIMNSRLLLQIKRSSDVEVPNTVFIKLCRKNSCIPAKEIIVTFDICKHKNQTKIDSKKVRTIYIYI
jgi:hypothetical protein